MSSSLTEFDDRELRCPQLGGQVPFKYCRTMAAGLPSARLSECWGDRLDVAAFLSGNYTPEQLQQITAPPGRLETIFETLARVKAERCPE